MRPSQIINRAIRHYPSVYRPLRRVGLTFRRRVFGVRHPIDDLINVCRHIRPAAVLDIGAHVGAFTREFAQYLPGTPIHAFEPTPSAFTLLQKNMRPFPTVSLHQLAVGDSNGTAEFYVNAQEQTNSLLDNDVDNELHLGGLVAHTDVLEVPEVTLESWTARHTPQGLLAIKADIQGAEMKMICGGQDVFRSRVAALVAEVSLGHMYKGESSFFDLHNKLTQELPFTLYQLYQPCSDGVGRALWMDALWVRTELLERLRS